MISMEPSAAGQPDGIRRLLLATDLSAASERAADEAISLAVEAGAELVVLSVIEPARLRLPGGKVLRRVDQERARIETGVQLLTSRAVAAGAHAAFLVWEGDPAESILAATSAKVFRLGDAAGIGSLVKTVNQLLAGVHIAAAAEAMALAAKAGADTRAVYEVISASAGNSWMFGNRVPHMLDDDYSPLSAVEIFVKDLGLVLDTGHELRLPLPIAAAAHQLFIAAAGAGWGRLDDAAVVKVYEQAGDFKVSSPKR